MEKKKQKLTDCKSLGELLKNKLPSDCFSEILLFLEERQRYGIRRTCKYFQAVFKEYKLLFKNVHCYRDIFGTSKTYWASYFLDVERCDYLNKYIINRKEDVKFRMLTYNVHEFKNLYNVDKKEEIIQVIKKIDADIVILQESSIKQIRSLHELYNYQASVKSESGANLYIVILSKIEIKEYKTIRLSNPLSDRQRFGIHAKGKDIDICGIHLTEGNVGTRKIEVDNLLKYIETKCGENLFILGDFNTIQKEEYNNSELEWITDHFVTGEEIKENTIQKLLVTKKYVTKYMQMKEKNIARNDKIRIQTKKLVDMRKDNWKKYIKLEQSCEDTELKELEELEDDFKVEERKIEIKLKRDSVDWVGNSIEKNRKLQSACLGKIKYTSMYGKKVDHILYNSKKYNCDFCATYYSSASDHLPYFADFKQK